jgi:hypothetical protein
MFGLSLLTPKTPAVAKRGRAVFSVYVRLFGGCSEGKYRIIIIIIIAVVVVIIHPGQFRNAPGSPPPPKPLDEGIQRAQ